MHPVPAGLTPKLVRVSSTAGTVALPASERLILTPEVAPGVRLVVTRTQGVGLVFSLWTQRDDVVALCSDARVPPGTALLAVDDGQLQAAAAAGLAVDLGSLAPCRHVPGLRYALVHYPGARPIRRAVQRVLPSSAAAA